MKFYPFNYCPFRYLHLVGGFGPTRPCECGYGTQTFDTIPDDVNYNVPTYGSLPSDLPLTFGCLLDRPTLRFADPDSPPKEWKQFE